jgi:hypothetical protein
MVYATIKSQTANMVGSGAVGFQTVVSVELGQIWQVAFSHDFGRDLNIDTRLVF